VKLVALGKAFDRHDMLAVARRRQRQTGQDTLAFDDDRARAARALIAPLLRSGQTEYVAESVQQRKARVQREFVGRVVDADVGFCVDHLVLRQRVHASHITPSITAAT
jgi:hypothetical protein